MIEEKKLMFLHGSESSSQTYKATILRKKYPGMVVPDFTGTLDERMEQLEGIIGGTDGWVLIGSSLGGLMAVLFAAKHTGQVRKLVLLAPALILPEFNERVREPISIPTVIIHGKQDEVVPVEVVHKLAIKTFSNLENIVVEDDHRLHKTAEGMDWGSLIDD